MKLLVFWIPLFIVAGGTGWCIIFVGKKAWIAFLTGVVAFFAIGFARMFVEKKLLAGFVCPHCKTPIPDWDRDTQYRVLYDCQHCCVRWDIGYVFGNGPSS